MNKNIVKTVLFCLAIHSNLQAPEYFGNEFREPVLSENGFSIARSKNNPNIIQAATEHAAISVEHTPEGTGKISGIKYKSDLALINSIDKQLMQLPLKDQSIAKKLQPDEKAALLNSVPTKINGLSDWQKFNNELDKIIALRSNKEFDHGKLLKDLSEAEKSNTTFSNLWDKISLAITKFTGEKTLLTNPKLGGRHSKTNNDSTINSISIIDMHEKALTKPAQKDTASTNPLILDPANRFILDSPETNLPPVKVPNQVDSANSETKIPPVKVPSKVALAPTESDTAHTNPNSATSETERPPVEERSKVDSANSETKIPPVKVPSKVDSPSRGTKRPRFEEPSPEAPTEPVQKRTPIEEPSKVDSAEAKDSSPFTDLLSPSPEAPTEPVQKRTPNNRPLIVRLPNGEIRSNIYINEAGQYVEVSYLGGPRQERIFNDSTKTFEKWKRVSEPVNKPKSDGINLRNEPLKKPKTALTAKQAAKLEKAAKEALAKNETNFKKAIQQIPKTPIKENNFEIFPGINRIYGNVEIPNITEGLNLILTKEFLQKNPSQYIQIVAKVLDVKPTLENIQQQILKLQDATTNNSSIIKPENQTLLKSLVDNLKIKGSSRRRDFRYDTEAALTDFKKLSETLTAAYDRLGIPMPIKTATPTEPNDSQFEYNPDVLPV